MYWLDLFRVAIRTRWYSERLSSLVKSFMTYEASGVDENFDEATLNDVGDTVGPSLQKNNKEEQVLTSSEEVGTL